MLTDLPIDVLELVLSQCAVRDVLRASAACRALHEAVRSETLWRAVCLAQYGHEAAALALTYDSARPFYDYVRTSGNVLSWRTTQARMHITKLNHATVMTLGMPQDGSLLLYAGQNDGMLTTVRYDRDEMTVVSTFQTGGHNLIHLVVSPDGTRLFFPNSDLTLFDAATQQPLWRHAGSNNSLPWRIDMDGPLVTWSPESEHSDYEIYDTRVKPGPSSLVTHVSNSVKALGVRLDGQYLFGSGSHGTELFDMRANKQLAAFKASPSAQLMVGTAKTPHGMFAAGDCDTATYLRYHDLKQVSFKVPARASWDLSFSGHRLSVSLPNAVTYDARESSWASFAPQLPCDASGLLLRNTLPPDDSTPKSYGATRSVASTPRCVAVGTYEGEIVMFQYN